MHAHMAAICLILNEDQILLMKQHENSFAAGRWSVIGGRAEPGETPDQTVLREVEEETGLILTQYRHAGHLLIYEGERVTSLSIYVATGAEGEVRGSDEGEPVWWPLSRVGKLDLVGYLRLILPHLLSPKAFLTGTIRIRADQEPVEWSLDRHAIAQTERVAG